MPNSILKFPTNRELYIPRLFSIFFKYCVVGVKFKMSIKTKIWTNKVRDLFNKFIGKVPWMPVNIAPQISRTFLDAHFVI